MTLYDVALKGLNGAEANLEATASRLARLPASLEGAGLGDVVDLSAEVVALLEARNLFEVNLKVIRTADEIQKHLLDVLL